MTILNTTALPASKRYRLAREAVDMKQDDLVSIPTVVVGGVSSQAGLASIVRPRPFAGIPLTNHNEQEQGR